MQNNLMLGLRTARKKSGLTQTDTGHLLGSSNLIISHLERGKRMPSIEELCALSLVYGTSFEAFYGQLLNKIREDLNHNLASLPSMPTDYPAFIPRQRTLNRLAEDLTSWSETKA